MKKDILTLLDLTREDFLHLFQRASELKKKHKNGVVQHSLAGKSLGLIFEKPSTRTRLSFETAMIQLGGSPIFISAKDTQIVRNEPVRDTARVLSRYVDAVAIRTFSQDLLKGFADFSDIPVINALTDLYHPCQVLSDLMTIIECRGDYQNQKIAWVGDGNNVAHSWINAASVIGLDLRLACPEGYEPKREILDQAAAEGCGKIMVTNDPREAVCDADVIYTDVWASMGQEREQTIRVEVFGPFQVNESLVKRASSDAIVMHCLPAHRGEEISEKVLEGPQSVVWEQAENKMHMHKAILEALIIERKKEK
ncbi:MAG: ornithine carbamoyltransferase [Desulfobacteraceae bacterium]|nr:MAG: ornithine carbamoyltransferase [Desulfobacteraceae bacterium]